MSDAVPILVPTLGESVSEAVVTKWLKKPGDPVQAEEPLVELETDKVTVEVPAAHAGILREITANEGETVSVNSILAMLETAEDSVASPRGAPSEAGVEQAQAPQWSNALEADRPPTAEEWAEFKSMVLREYISRRLDTPDSHLSFIREKLSNSREAP